MHLRIFPDHQNQNLQKIIFERLEWLKTCFYAFAHTSRLPESSSKKIILFTSGVVENVF
jgi:hypothetical protein